RRGLDLRGRGRARLGPHRRWSRCDERQRGASRLMTEPLSPTAARRVFLTLTATRWMPVGFIVGILVLWMLERGLSLPSAMSAMAVIGFVVLLLELPTSGFADALGRRPVLIVAALANLASMVALILAHSFTGFVIVAVLTGVFRALDS